VPDYGDKRNTVYNGWIRPTITWSLECEAQGKSRQDAYNTYVDNDIDGAQLNFGA
jgi:hypothetical protein